MLEPDGSPNTAHSLNPVPFVVTVDGRDARSRGRHPRRRRADRARAARHRAAAGDDRPLAAGRPRPRVTVAAAALALFVGAALQSATGFGFALVSAPILFALLGPREAVTDGRRRRDPAQQPHARDRAPPAAGARPRRGRARRLVAAGHRARRDRAARGARAAAVGRRRARGPRGPGAARPQPARRRGRRGRGAWHVPVAGVTAGALGTSTSLNGPPLVFCLLARRSASPRRCATRSRRSSSPRRVLGLPALLLSGTFTAPRAVGRAPARGARRPARRPARVRLAAGRSLRERGAGGARADGARRGHDEHRVTRRRRARGGTSLASRS